MKAKMLALVLLWALVSLRACSQQEVRSNQGNESHAKTQNEAERVETINI